MKKISKFLFTVCGCALATSMVMAPAGTVALAASGDFQVNTGAVETTVEYNSTFSVPAAPSGYTVTVIKPNGEEIANASGDITADLLGHYTVKYSKGDVSYTYTVFSSNERAYEIEVDDTVIPSYLAVGGTATLPTAKAFYKNADGEKVYVNENVQPVITGYITETGTPAFTVEDGVYTFPQVGAAKVSYVCPVGTGVYASADYEIRIQKDFVDTTAPSLSISGWTDQANVNMEYVLPIALATDNYDSRVKVTVTVTDPNKQPVKVYPVNENGYAYVVGDETELVEFDNKNVTKFYPVEKGIYNVVYEAVDDANNAAKKIEKIINVKDLKGPTINVERASIPQNWGYNKVAYSVDGTETALADTAIVFPIPTYYDNTGSDNLEVSLRLRNAEGDDVFKVNNIQKGDEADLPAKYVTKVAEGFKFDVKSYITDLIAEKGNSQYAIVGTYSAQYTVIDKDTGSTTTTPLYQISIKDEYVDENPVEIGATKDIEKSVVIGVGDTFTLPAYNVSSKSDSNLVTSYAISNGTDTTDFNGFYGGEKLELVKDSDKYYLVYNKDGVETAKLEVAEGENTVSYIVSATADSGASKTVNTDSTKVIVKANAPKTYTVSTVNNADGQVSEVKIALASGVENKYVGVEVGLRDADYNYKWFKATVYYDAYSNSKVIGSIAYPNVTEDATHYLEVRVFDIYGTSTVNVFEVNLTKEEVDAPVETDPTAAFASSTTLGNSIAWANTKFTISPSVFEGKNVDDYYKPVAHTVEGGRFSTMGDEFTPLAATTYTILDEIFIINKADGVNVTEQFQLAKGTPNTVKVTSNATKTVALDAPMPVYLAKNATGADIPGAVIYDAEKNYTYTAEVTDPSNNTKKLDDSYVFSADGSYTIKFIVADSAVSTYTIKVGDNAAPQFKVTAPASRLSKGATIKFSAVTFEDGSADADKAGDYTYTKTVYNASGAIVGKQLTGDGKSWANKTGEDITLSSAGEYTVVYSVMDKAGNESVQKFTIMVSDSAQATNADATVIGTIIIIVAVIGIAGAVIYIFTGAKPAKKKED